MSDKRSVQEPPECAPRTMSVPDAGRIYLGISRNSAYEAARRGDIPVVQVGRLKRVPILAMEQKLEAVGQ